MSTGSGLRNDRLFPFSTRTTRAQESAERANRILQQMDRTLQHPHAQTTQELERQARQLESAIRGIGGRLPVEGQLMRLASSIERIARQQSNSLVHQVLGAMGTPGSLIQSWLRGREGSQSLRPIRDNIQQALNLLSQFAPQLLERPLTPDQAGGRRIGDWFEGAAVPELPEMALRIPAPSAAPISTSGRGGGRGGGGGRDWPNGPSGPRYTNVLPDGRIEIRAPGYHRILRPDDPVLTGVMQRVASSNVYAIGFQFNPDYPLHSRLIVRYKQKDRGGSGRMRSGPTYEYLNVHPDFFGDLVDAASKGRWIWDQLRIRGSIAGHQYQYNIIGVGQGYLPRRAVVQGGTERLLQRTRTQIFADGRRERITSALPNQTLGRYSPTAHRPNVGNPDRGAPNRGAPFRGR
jgi:hypothetical protein